MRPFAPALVILLGIAQAAVATPLDVGEAMQAKPVLSVILDTPGRLEWLGQDLHLSAQQIAAIEEVAAQERMADRDLHMDQPPVEEWNARTQATADRTVTRLNEILGPLYAGFVAELQPYFDHDAARSGPTGRSCLSYTVYGTQYVAHTTYEIALPDQYVKFANLGWQNYTGYEGSNYEAQLDRSGYSYVEWVGDVGPWNTDDNYWNPVSGTPRPRRLFTDLPQGEPEAEQAYYYGYNGGLDQFGRTVGNPAGVDLAPATATAIGLAYLQNDWITVTYLWECSCDGPCEPGEVQSQDCCDCGSQSRTCGDDCQWGGWSACDGPDPGGGETVCDTGEPGVCAEGRERCVEGCVECQRIVDPTGELCDALDNDCNGEVDDGQPTQMGDPPPAYAAEIADASYPRSLEPGGETSAWVEYRNLGSEVWEAGEIWLGTVDTEDDTVSVLYHEDAWPSWNVAAPLEADVAPGEIGFFLFAVRAPDDEGAVAAQGFRPVNPQGERMGCPAPEVVLEVKVSAGGSAAPGTGIADPDVSASNGCRCGLHGGPSAPGRIGLACLAALAARVRRRGSRAQGPPPGGFRS